MPIDRSQRLGFVHIPKTAGTAIEKALDLHGDWRVEDRNRCYGRIRSDDLLRRRYATNYLQHLSLRELEAFLAEEAVDGMAEWTWFSVVRHPWARLLSAFRRKDPDLCQLYAYRCDRDLHSLDLASFLEVAAWLDHPHLRPQVRFLENTRLPLQTYRYEQLPTLAGWLTVRLGRPVTFERLNLPLIPLEEVALSDAVRLQERVGEIYAEDMEQLGYGPALETRA